MGSSNIGALVTGVFRERADDAFTGGIDHNLRWDQNRVRWDGHWVVTHAPGPGGMKTSGGGVTNFNVSRKNFNIGTHYDHFGRDFRVNDIGFFRTRANRNQAEGYGEVGQPDPWKIFRRFWGFSSYGYGWTDERLIINDYFETGVSFQFLNYWNFNVGGGRNGDVLRRSGYTRRPADLQARLAVLVLQREQRLAEAMAAQSGRQRLEERRWRVGRQRPGGSVISAERSDPGLGLGQLQRRHRHRAVDCQSGPGWRRCRSTTSTARSTATSWT